MWPRPFGVSLIACALCLIDGCSSTSKSSTKIQACEPGASALCSALSGCTGTKLCNGDGQTFGECQCEAGVSGGSAGSGGSAAGSSGGGAAGVGGSGGSIGSSDGGGRAGAGGTADGGGSGGADGSSDAGACREHGDCPSGACRFATGACFEEVNRLWVSAAANCGTATGSEQAPFCTVDEALAVVSAQPGNEPWAVFVAGHATPYTLSEDAGLPARPFALIGPARGLGAVLRGSAPSHLYVFGAQFDRYLARVILDGTSAEGTVLDCRSGDLWVDDVEIRGGTLGLYAAVCDVRMRRSRIVNAAEWGAKVDVDARLTMDEGGIENNQGGVLTEGSVTLRRTSIIGNYLNGGISARSGTLSLSNSVLWQNVYAIGHIDLGLTASATLNYVVALGESLSCSSASSTYAIKNSIIDNITCTNASVTVDRSLVASTHVALGQGNVGFPLADYDQVFVDHSGGDFHIRPDPPAYLLGIAVRSPTDPAVDFDGDARPSVGAPDYPGIDAP